MSVLNEITKAVTDKAKTAARISSDMVEVTKLNVAIGGEEDKINKLYNEIGKKVYANFSESKDVGIEEIADSCSAIKEIERNISEMKARIFSLKKIKECSGCKEILDVDMSFCFKCGEKQPVVEIIIEEADIPEGEVFTDENREE